jgi:hypothetical protein
MGMIEKGQKGRNGGNSPMRPFEADNGKVSVPA